MRISDWSSDVCSSDLVVDVRFYRGLAAHSALTDPGRFELPAGRKPEEIATGIPVTYVPLRNTFFLTLAAASLESRVLQAIETEGRAPEDLDPVLYIAANALDYSGYPDCRDRKSTRLHSSH